MDQREEPVVRIRELSRRFGGKTALDRVSLEVPVGSVLGIVGENGAGKTTLIKHVLGLLRAEAGSVRVFGLDPSVDPTSVLARLGYLSEEPDLPDWMRVQELLCYVSAFYPSWDHGYADELRGQFGLDGRKRLRELSKGQRARVGLVTALAHRPALLVLDEPSSGLDPVVRRDILAAIIRTIADEGRTVLFSSHLLSEVERVSDRVAMVRKGRVLFCDELDRVKDLHARLTVRFDAPRETPPSLDGAFAWEGKGQEWSMVYAGDPAELPLDGATLVDRAGMTLDEIFLARSAAEERS